ncbi:MAG TPA: fluoride efflux transporter CrcB [Anaerohalosphaeraceae bacterium]|nr:fluoride efflux transporter CrcB [Anaerohalosphaeraceae bacterium]HOL31511.1 fluoride efflux transporter CrcB [Anaerohalosphaeraceae bacterium]HOM75566.1 fluoride efflux transporter CrcB [Anaerohalosphaeraceae bacterium]HPC64348.1 fluoride efflux transporter CrcB [Anaerohalosphaeraceae bacterium]HPO69158.1 fluoride efflux transporter CrcB [Anaerohalosphaeraceae bacterium]
MLQKLLWLGLAGAAGTLTRYWLSGLVQKNVSVDFPIGTMTVNIVGCLLFGLLWAFIESRLSISGQMRMIIFLGFFGAFTTFSSFAFETSQLLDESQWLWAAGNILLQNILCLAGMITGLTVGRWI